MDRLEVYIVFCLVIFFSTNQKIMLSSNQEQGIFEDL